jgi:aquaporin Z
MFRIECHMNARAARLHWPEYLIEAGAIGTFMVSAAGFAALLYYPASWVAAGIHSELLRRGLMGLAMGLTAMAIIYSPAGQRSGAHMNPAVTLTFFRLGKIDSSDAVAYVVAQFAGAALGLAGIATVLRGIVSDPSVNYVTTIPGPAGVAVAFAAELTISFVLMWCVLAVSNDRRVSAYTGVCAGLLVWLYITVEAPLSGMSMNPARTLGSALLAADFRSLWIYFAAPPLGMLTAAELFVRRHGLHRVLCAKLHHPHTGPCHFACAMKLPRTANIETP